MRRTSLALPLLLITAPVAAQSPVPNYPVQNAYQREELIRQQAEFFHQQHFSTAGVDTAGWRNEYRAVPAALAAKRGAPFGRSGIGRARMSDPLYRAATLDVPLIAVTSRGVTPAHLDPASPTPIFVTRQTPLRLSIVSPDAGASDPVRVDVTLSDLAGVRIAEFHGGLATDEGAMVRVELPGLRVGEYLLRVTTGSLGTGIITTHTAEQRLIAPAQ
jgi:hypothetical protein